MSMPTLQVDQRLKGLKSQLVKRKSEYEVLNAEQKILSRKVQEVLKHVRELEKSIEDSTPEHPTELYVTEHAMLRYMERVKGLDLQELEKEMLSERALSAVQQLGGKCKVKCNGYTLIVKDNTIVTVE